MFECHRVLTVYDMQCVDCASCMNSERLEEQLVVVKLV